MEEIFLSWIISFRSEKLILNEGIKKWEKEKSVDMFDRPRTIITVECFKKQPSSLIGVAITFTIGLSYQVIVLFQFPDPLRFKSRTCRPKYIYVYILRPE